jgi:DNA repair/transcription protein MET18/MMS19
MLQFLQILVNKFGAAKEPLQNEKRSLPQIMLDMTVLSTPNHAMSKTVEITRIYQAMAYFAGAALAAGDSYDHLLIDQMIKGLDDPFISRQVAQSFCILLAPSPIMSKENFCTIRKLCKQRLYNMAVERLITQWRQTQSKDQKASFLVALAGVLAHMEPAILVQHVSEIFPAILEGTAVQNDDAMFSYVSLLKGLIEACSEVALEYAPSIANRMIDRIRNSYLSPSDASPRCRVAALEALALMTEYLDGRTLLPLRGVVLAELAASADDCSRAVRSAAQLTKMRWANLMGAAE